MSRSVMEDPAIWSERRLREALHALLISNDARYTLERITSGGGQWPDAWASHLNRDDFAGHVRLFRYALKALWRDYKEMEGACAELLSEGGAPKGNKHEQPR